MHAARPVALDNMDAGAPSCSSAGVARGVVRAHVVDRVPARLAQAWAELAASASEPNSFAEPWFFDASLRHLSPDAGVRLLEVWDGARLTGLMPLAIGRRYGRTPVRFVQNWLHHHHFLGTPLVRAGEEQAFWTSLLTSLDQADWAPHFLHVAGLAEHGPVHRGLAAAAAALCRPAPVVYRETRALLESDLAPDAYYERTIRKKKRKEIARLRNRLAEQGRVESRRLARADEIRAWCDVFLALERAGWKGKAGSALACAPGTEAFFRDAVAGAFAAGKLQFLRLDLDGRPLAMLINFLAPPGAFSFKTAFDEDFARFSPGVLIQLDNLAILSRPDIGWMDSCAAEDHPMIDSLWAERRTVARVTVPLAGWRRRCVFLACRALETGSAALRASMERFR